MADRARAGMPAPAGIPASPIRSGPAVPGGVAPAEEDGDRDQDPRDGHEQEVPGEPEEPEERPHQGARDEDGDNGDEDQAEDAVNRAPVPRAPVRRAHGLDGLLGLV